MRDQVGRGERGGGVDPSSKTKNNVKNDDKRNTKNISPFKCLRICKRPLSWSLLPKAFDFCLVLTYGFYVTEANFFHWRDFLRQCMPNAKKTFSVDVKFIRQSMKFQFLGWVFSFFDTTDVLILRQQWKASTIYLWFFLIFDVVFVRQWLQFYVFSLVFSSPDVTFLRQHLFLPGADVCFLRHCNEFLRFSCTDVWFLRHCSEFPKKLVFVLLT